MSGEDLLRLLADGTPRVLYSGTADVLVATGAAEWVEGRTFEEGIQNKIRGRSPLRITPRGLRLVDAGKR